MSRSVFRHGVGPLVVAVISAGIAHSIAAAHLAAVDPITALFGREHQGALVTLIATRLFLMFAAPAWAVRVAARAVARAVYRLK